MTADEINTKIREALNYDEYQYQKDNNILIKEPYRAEGLHRILYQCPNCKTEFEMDTKGAELFCKHCGKRWVWHENGYLEALEGETEFDHIPDWYNWQREQVKKQIKSGKYNFIDEVDVYSQPHCWRFRPLGKANIVHNADEGFVLTGHYRGKDYKIKRAPLENIAIQIEYDFSKIKHADCFCITISKDNFYCFPKNQMAVTKIGLATEEIYNLKIKDVKKTTSKKKD